ncbi:hypothetical protein RFI_34379, partial [Reticulomyxa filosa]
IQKKKDVQLSGHSGDGFLTIWSTISGYQVADFSLLSEHIKSVAISKYKSGYPFKQMLNDVRQEIRKSNNGEWYCVETQDTTSYDMQKNILKKIDGNGCTSSKSLKQLVFFLLVFKLIAKTKQKKYYLCFF